MCTKKRLKPRKTRHGKMKRRSKERNRKVEEFQSSDGTKNAQKIWDFLRRSPNMSSPRSALLPKDREKCEIQQRHFAYGVGKGRIEPFPSRWGVACLLKQIYEAKQAMHDRADKKFFIEEKRSTPPKIKSRNDPQRSGLGGGVESTLAR